jgi:hypothetical protein
MPRAEQSILDFVPRGLLFQFAVLLTSDVVSLHRFRLSGHLVFESAFAIEHHFIAVA